MNNFQFNHLVYNEKRQIRYIGNIIGLALLTLIVVPVILVSFISAFRFDSVIKSILSSNVVLGEILLILLDSFVYSVTMLVPFIIIASKFKMYRHIESLFQKPTDNINIYAIFIFLGSTVLGVMSISILIFLLNAVGFEVASPQMYIPKSLIGMFFYFIQLAVLPAILEELLFRGAIMQSLRIKGDKFALIASSLIFAVVHGNFIQMVNAFVLGIVIGYFVIKTNSIWLGIVMHFLNNGNAAISSLILENVGEGAAVILTMSLNVIFVVTGIICFSLYKKHKLHFNGVAFADNRILPCSQKISAVIFTSALLAIFIINILQSFSYISFVGR